MFQERAFAYVDFPTVLTLIKLHSGVDLLVAKELCVLVESSSTLATLKGLLRRGQLGVTPLVLNQLFPTAEGFLTRLTCKAFLTLF